MPEGAFPKFKPHPFREHHEPGELAPRVDAGGAPNGAPPAYAELCVTSNYTFLTGASHPEEFVLQASALGYGAVAVTDTHTLAGVVRAHVAARDAGLRFVLGTRLRPVDLPGCGVCVYPTDMASYRRLCRLLTVGKRRAPKGECRLVLDDLAQYGAGLVAVAAFDGDPTGDARERLGRLCKLFDDDRLSLGASVGYAWGDGERLARLAVIAESSGVPLVATNDVAYHHADRRMLHDVVACIRHGCTLGQAGFRLNSNGERHLKPPEEMVRLFAGYPGAIARTIEITERTSGFSLDQLRYEYPDEIVPPGRTPQEHLVDLTWAGARDRYGEGVPPKVRGLIEHELGLIEELGYAPYFLTVYDLVRFARSGEEHAGRGPIEGWKGEILCQGRGAAANSAVCFCLGVTAVNPTEIDVLFERFVSKERNEPPDIDIDFEHERREEVIQYIYRKYGRERAALTAEVITYRRRSAVRDVGKALGLSLDLVDRLAKDIEWFDSGIADAKRLRELGVNPDDATMRWFVGLVKEILGFPRHLSQHVGGFVITRSPLCELVPIENAAMPDRTVVEWDKDDIDAVGMLKVDVLGLGMLTMLRRCFAFVNGRHKGTEAQRHKGKGSHGQDTDLSGLAGVATRQGTREGGVSGDGDDAGPRAVRTDESDATGCGVNPVEHRRGVCASGDCGLLEIPPDRSGITRGIMHAVRTGGGHDHDPVGTRRRGAAGGSGSDASSAHHADSGEDVGAGASSVSTLCLCASVPVCLDTSTPLSIANVPRDDEGTYAMIQRADTVGVFQIESRAQMSMLPRLKPRTFYDLVIEVAIVRPGPIQGGMVHPYLRRRDGLESPETLPDEVPEHVRRGVDEVLNKTLGVPLFQEQCMALAIRGAGFTPGKADQLRRAMAAWKRKGDQIHGFGRELVEGMMRNNIPEGFARRCFKQIEGFSEYGFPESHAASFAVLVYVSAWLKCHYPGEFCAALLNSQPMGFYPPAQIVRDAKEHGVRVLPIDVAHSEWECTMEEGRHIGTEAQRHQVGGERRFQSPTSHSVPLCLCASVPSAPPAIRLGMQLAGGVGEPDARRLRDAVVKHGPFRSMLALWRASGVKVRTMRRLAAADAFGSMGLSRQQALWQARLLRDDPLPLFDREPERADASAREVEGLDRLPAIAPLHQVVLDYDATGLSLKAHPVSFARERLRALGVLPCSAMRDPALTPEGELVTVAGLVLVRQRPGTAKDVTFITLEDETGVANLVVWLRVYQKYRRAAGARLLVATGRIQRAGEVVHLVVTKMRAFDRAVEDLKVDVRNFH
jgi:error-prone DNA polymerase